MACVTTLPVVGFDDACPSILRGQVYKIYTTRPTSVDELADVTDLDEWVLRIDPDAAMTAANVAAPIREWSGIGSWAEAEVTDIDIPLDQLYSLSGNKVLSFKVYDLSAINSAAFVAMRAAKSFKTKLWSAQDSTIWGGDAGIDGFMRADLVVPEGCAELQYGQITFTTKASINEVSVTPFAIL